MRLGPDPIGAAYAEGYAIPVQEIKELLNLVDASDRELVGTLQALLAERESLLGGTPAAAADV